MSKEEFAFKVKEVSQTIRSIIDDDGVRSHTFLYGFLSSAAFALDIAVTCVNDEYVSNDLVEVTLSHD